MGEVDSVEVRARVELEAAIREYYMGWPNRRLPGRPPGICDVDRGHRCLGADLDGGCSVRKRKCRSWEESALLVERLTRLALDHPSDPVVTAHAVYAAVKLSFVDEAVRVLEACDGDGLWLCDLMAGYARHRMGSPAGAAPAFRSALDAMDPETRCLFTDIEWFLSGPVRDRYRATPCGARADLHDWFWWASDPLLAADATNDRWTEHLARIVERMMSEDFETRRSWTDRRRSQHPRWMEFRVLRGPSDSVDPRISRRPEPFGGWTSRSAAFNHFVPEVFALDSLHPGLEYRLEARVDGFGIWGDEGYTRAGGRVHEIPAQYARFLEGDSMVVAVASRLAESGIGGTGQAFFMASPGPGDVVTLPPAPLRETVVFAGQVANRRQVVGLEVVTLGDDARSRDVMEPLPDREPLLSDLLLYRPVGPDLPETRTRAAGMMHGTPRIPRNPDLGLYWEAYGLPPHVEVEASVRLDSVEGGGFFDGLARALGLGGADETGAVSWTVATPEAGIFTHAITLDLETLDEDTYDLVLTMTAPDGSRVERTRRFQVVDEEGAR